MFLTAPIVWLQTWASPALTRTLEVISWFGYTRVAIAFAVLVAFAFHLRAGLALLLLLAVNGVAIDLAKTAAALPRPFAVAADVRVLGWPAPAPVRWGTATTRWWELPRSWPPPSRAIAGEQPNDADSETGFGFPSGHVSTTLIFVACIAALARRGWVTTAGVMWLSLMALSRLYLGRHFVGDVVGGLALGSLVLAVGVTALRVRAFTFAPARGDVERAARLTMLIAAAVLGSALIVGRPDVGDAGRLAGLAVAVLCLTHFDRLNLPPRPLTRAGLVTIAALSYGLVWGALTLGVQPSRAAATHGQRLAASAVPAFAMLCVPALFRARNA